MSESTAEQQSAAEPSLSDDLEAVYDQLTNEGGDDDELQGGGAEDGAGSGAGGEGQEGTDSNGDGEASDESNAGGEGQDSGDGDKGGQEKEGADEKLAAPEHWRAEHKEVFEKLDPEGQKFLLERHKEMEGDYTRKRQQDAELIKQAESLAPINEIFRHFPGHQPVPTIQQWATIAYNLQQNPQQTIQQLAQQYKVDLSQQEDQGFVDPQVQTLQQKLDALQQSIEQQEQQKTQAQQQSTLNKIQEFSEAKTEAGEPAHPYIEELMPDMVRLAHAERVAGREPSLEKLYEDAKWINPTVREKVESAQRKAAEKKAEAEARAKAEKARKAAKTSTSGTGMDSPSDDLGLREQIESQFN